MLCSVTQCSNRLVDGKKMKTHHGINPADLLQQTPHTTRGGQTSFYLPPENGFPPIFYCPPRLVLYRKFFLKNVYI